MATAVQKIILSSSRDIPFNKLLLSQSNVRRVKAGVSIEDLAASIARRGLIRLDPHRPSWIFHQKTTARITANPATFAEAFRQIGRKTTSDEPTTEPADERLFCGNLGSGILFLTSRLRPMDPGESFYSSHVHRLCDSQIGRGGHWIDIAVRGDCSDRDLALIERLAQATDTRPVVVRRILAFARTARTGGGS